MNQKQKIEKELIKDTERVHIEYEKLQNTRTCIELRHEALIEDLNDDSCRATLAQQKEECFEADNMKKTINDEHKLCYLIINTISTFYIMMMLHCILHVTCLRLFIARGTVPHKDKRSDCEHPQGQMLGLMR